MAKPREPRGVKPPPTDRQILRAYVRASAKAKVAPGDPLMWESRAFDPERLTEELLALSPSQSGARRRVRALAERTADRLCLRVSETGPIALPGLPGLARAPRWLAAEALTAVGSGLLPTRYQAWRTAREAARELAYFGAGELSEQLLEHPSDAARAAFTGEEVSPRPAVIDDCSSPHPRRAGPLELLRSDPAFQRDLEDDHGLEHFQARLREDPLDATVVARLQDFFSRRITIGIRDTTRWALGSRHPWFDWSRARELLQGCIERHARMSFLAPRLLIYAPNVELDDAILERQLAANARAAELLGQAIARNLSPALAERLGPVLGGFAHAALDCRRDLPVFDLEAEGPRGMGASFRFVGHAASVMAASTLGRPRVPRLNKNLQAHLSALGFERLFLGQIEPAEREEVYRVLDLALEVQELHGARSPEGGVVPFERPPHLIYSFAEKPGPRPRAGERVLDSFSLAELREPGHARSLRDHPAVFEQLVLFFTLALRQRLDTGSAPDLRPEDWFRDLMLLGLWGSATPQVVVNLYERRGKVRSEVRFLGDGQVEAFRGKNKGALTRLVASRLAPAIEPSLLRVLGAFLMAAEESQDGPRVAASSPLDVARHSLELFRETARIGVKGTLVDAATLLEVLIDSTVNAAQGGLDRLSQSLQRKK